MAIRKKTAISLIALLFCCGGGGGIAAGTLLSKNQQPILQSVETEEEIKEIVPEEPQVSVFIDPHPEKYKIPRRPYPAGHKPSLPGKITNNSLIKHIQRSSDIEANVTKIYCSNRLFADYIQGSGKEGRSNNLKQDTQMFKITDSYNIGSCMTVLWQRTHYKNDKGKGQGRFIGSFRKGTYGAIFVSTLEAKDGKLMIDGNAYILSTTELSYNVASGATTRVQGKDVAGHENTERKEVTAANKNELVPLPDSTALPGAVEDGGFVFDETNVCGEDECTNEEDIVDYTSSVEAGSYKRGGGKGAPRSFRGGSKNSNAGASIAGLFPEHVADNYKDIRGYFVKEQQSVIY